MKRIFIILCLFTVFFNSCETNFDVNAEWEEIAVVYGLLDAGKDLQQIKISKAFLGDMASFEMAQYADSINYGIDELDVKIYKWDDNILEDSVVDIDFTVVPYFRDSEMFYDSVIIYEFLNDNDFLPENNAGKSKNYELVIKNRETNNVVTSNTKIICDFSFLNVPSSFQFGFVAAFNENESPYTVEYSSTTLDWGASTDNGTIYQIDLIIHYIENGDSINLIYTAGEVSGNDSRINIEGEAFFDFLRNQIAKDETKTRFFNSIDIVMTVGSEDLESYINVNEPVTGIVQERPYFTNINNGIGLFSSRLTYRSNDFPLTTPTLKYLKSSFGLDRNF